MNTIDIRILLMILVIAAVISLPVLLIKKMSKKVKKSPYQTNVCPKDGPYIAAEYIGESGMFEDGKCGWLDVECETGEETTIVLNFNKKAPLPIFVPLKVAKYRITYRAKSKAGLVASNVMKSINESSGAMGAFANAVYEAGEMNRQLSTIVVDVTEDFVLKLGCSADAFEKHCVILP